MYWVVILLVFACKQPYTPPVISAANNNILVVEGTINVGPDSTVIHLTNTKNLNDTGPVNAVMGANIVVQGQDGSNFPLIELGGGYYATAAIAGNTATQYRLSIAAPNGRQYVSDYVPAVSTPAIDSLTFMRQNDGVHIYVNTHDNTNTAKYFRWSYVETWEHDAPYESLYYYQNGLFFFRTPSQLIYQCYKTDNSTGISIFSTTQLSKDVVFQNPVAFVPLSDERIGVEYSILVNQYAITQTEYNYWQTLSANTENLGSLFDPLPSALTGNIHCVTDTSETVLGYIGAGAPQQARIFINKFQVEPWLYPPLPASICDSFIVHTVSDYAMFADGAEIPVAQLPNMGPWWGSTPLCVDCRVSGGTTIKPPYWP